MAAKSERGGKPRLSRTLSAYDAVPIKTRMYSAWYRFRYGEVAVPSFPRPGMHCDLFAARLAVSDERAAGHQSSLAAGKVLSLWSASGWVCGLLGCPYSSKCIYILYYMCICIYVCVRVFSLVLHIHVRSEFTEDSELRNEGVPPHIIDLLDHYYSLSWMTYRTNFTPIANTHLTTDCGWGCMVRSGQMLLATALHYYLLGRGQWLSRNPRYNSSVHPLWVIIEHRLLEALYHISLVEWKNCQGFVVFVLLLIHIIDWCIHPLETLSLVSLSEWRLSDSSDRDRTTHTQVCTWNLTITHAYRKRRTPYKGFPCIYSMYVYTFMLCMCVYSKCEKWSDDWEKESVFLLTHVLYNIRI